ncbi:chromatin-silencing protein SIR4 RNJ42_04240 [Nakaseomyces bracarensis]|uniref:chromatin-silencing protein SIR4 n=1 Tax=Nakaseomyces bracarensis TaxID=273131 RepID=UPI0038728138
MEMSLPSDSPNMLVNKCDNKIISPDNIDSKTNPQFNINHSSKLDNSNLKQSERSISPCTEDHTVKGGDEVSNLNGSDENTSIIGKSCPIEDNEINNFKMSHYTPDKDINVSYNQYQYRNKKPPLIPLVRYSKASGNIIRKSPTSPRKSNNLNFLAETPKLLKQKDNNLILPENSIFSQELTSNTNNAEIDAGSALLRKPVPNETGNVKLLTLLRSKQVPNNTTVTNGNVNLMERNNIASPKTIFGDDVPKTSHDDNSSNTVYKPTAANIESTIPLNVEQSCKNSRYKNNDRSESEPPDTNNYKIGSPSDSNKGQINASVKIAYSPPCNASTISNLNGSFLTDVKKLLVGNVKNSDNIIGKKYEKIRRTSLPLIGTKKSLSPHHTPKKSSNLKLNTDIFLSQNGIKSPPEMGHRKSISTHTINKAFNPTNNSQIMDTVETYDKDICIQNTDSSEDNLKIDKKTSTTTNTGIPSDKVGCRENTNNLFNLLVSNKYDNNITITENQKKRDENCNVLSINQQDLRLSVSNEKEAKTNNNISIAPKDKLQFPSENNNNNDTKPKGPMGNIANETESSSPSSSNSEDDTDKQNDSNSKSSNCNRPVIPDNIDRNQRVSNILCFPEQPNSNSTEKEHKSQISATDTNLNSKNNKLNDNDNNNNNNNKSSTNETETVCQQNGSELPAKVFTNAKLYKNTDMKGNINTNHYRDHSSSNEIDKTSRKQSGDNVQMNKDSESGKDFSQLDKSEPSSNGKGNHKSNHGNHSNFRSSAQIQLKSSDHIDSLSPLRKKFQDMPQNLQNNLLDFTNSDIKKLEKSPTSSIKNCQNYIHSNHTDTQSNTVHTVQNPPYVSSMKSIVPKKPQEVFINKEPLSPKMIENSFDCSSNNIPNTPTSSLDRIKTTPNSASNIEKEIPISPLPGTSATSSKSPSINNTNSPKEATIHHFGQKKFDIEINDTVTNTNKQSEAIILNSSTKEAKFNGYRSNSKSESYEKNRELNRRLASRPLQPLRSVVVEDTPLKPAEIIQQPTDISGKMHVIYVSDEESLSENSDKYYDEFEEMPSNLKRSVRQLRDPGKEHISQMIDAPKSFDFESETRNTDRFLNIEVNQYLHSKNVYNRSTILELIEKAIPNHNPLEKNSNVSVTNDICSVENYQTSHAFHYQQLHKWDKLVSEGDDYSFLRNPSRLERSAYYDSSVVVLDDANISAEGKKKINLSKEEQRNMWIKSLKSSNVFFFSDSDDNYSNPDFVFLLHSLLTQFKVNYSRDFNHDVDIVISLVDDNLNNNSWNLLKEKIRKSPKKVRVWSLYKAVDFIKKLGAKRLNLINFSDNDDKLENAVATSENEYPTQISRDINDYSIRNSDPTPATRARDLLNSGYNNRTESTQDLLSISGHPPRVGITPYQRTAVMYNYENEYDSNTSSIPSDWQNNKDKNTLKRKNSSSYCVDKDDSHFIGKNSTGNEMKKPKYENSSTQTTARGLINPNDEQMYRSIIQNLTDKLLTSEASSVSYKGRLQSKDRELLRLRERCAMLESQFFRNDRNDGTQN